MISRLSSVAPDLVARLEQLLPDPLRRAAASAAILAVERTQLADQRLDAALAALHDGRFGDTAERSGVQHLTDELDQIAWDAQEKADSGLVSRQTYSAAFRRARAAASVGFALDSDALNAALEAVYEAKAAVADLDLVRSVVGAALQ
jgi:hypothetical protein